MIVESIAVVVFVDWRLRFGFIALSS